jgi:hypothetical protein
LFQQSQFDQWLLQHLESQSHLVLLLNLGLQWSLEILFVLFRHEHPFHLELPLSPVHQFDQLNLETQLSLVLLWNPVLLWNLEILWNHPLLLILELLWNPVLLFVLWNLVLLFVQLNLVLL